MGVAIKAPRMTVTEFLDWAMHQPEGRRYELVDGQPVAMSPERSRHNLVKFAVARALGDGIARTSLACTAFTDGMTVAIDEHRSREPDAAVQCGPVDPDALALDAPVIVVEVISPSSARQDTSLKLIEYFSLPSVVHYLVVDPDLRRVIHHKRMGEDIRTLIVADGDLRFDPPGFAVSVAALYPPA